MKTSETVRKIGDMVIWESGVGPLLVEIIELGHNHPNHILVRQNQNGSCHEVHKDFLRAQ
jgi:hypothetical protein